MATGRIGNIGQGVQRLDAPLNSVEAVLAALVEACAPAPPVMLAPSLAQGAVAASDVRARLAEPPSDIALIDGRALSSADLIGASAMSPAILSVDPPPVEAGDALPPGCDCVIEEDLVAGAAPMVEAQGSAAPGEGVRRAGEDLQEGALLLRAGERVTPLAVLALALAGVAEIAVRRPRVTVVAVPHHAGAASSAQMVAALAHSDGAHATLVNATGRGAQAIAQAASSRDCDAIFIVGGTGSGASDHAVEVLRGARAIAHGLALDPGRSAAAGFLDGVPALCIPGRFDSALAVYLALAQPLLRRLSGAPTPAFAHEGPLTRKIASTVGLSQIVLLEASGHGWAPLAIGAITLSHVLRADGWMIAPQASEGVPEGALVTPCLMPGRSARS